MPAILVVGFDPGHGGPDSGAVANGVMEGPLNLALCELFAEAILALGAGRVVMLRRREDTEKVPLHVRGERARLGECDLVLSVHNNINASPGVCGGTFYHWPGNDRGRQVAEMLHRCWPHPLQRPRRQDAIFPALEDSPGDWLQRPRDVLAPHGCPAVLIEAGFLSHAGDVAVLQDELVRRAMVPAVVAAVLRFEQLRRAGH